MRHKTVLLTCSLVLIASVATGLTSYLTISKFAEETAIETIAGETRLSALQIRESYQNIYRDTDVISRTPPIQGLIRSTQNRGVDPIDKSTTTQWKNRLSEIFTTVMSVNSSYTQIRYIGVAANGRELVRVDRKERGIVAIPDDQLQPKEREPYFIAGLNLRPGEAYFSRITLNREYGQVTADKIPTIRCLVPVFTGEGSLFGFIIINANYPEILSATLSKLNNNRRTYAFSPHLDYMFKDEQNQLGPFNFRDNYVVNPSQTLLALAKSSKAEDVNIGPAYLSYKVRSYIDFTRNKTFVDVVQQIPVATALKAAKEVQFQTALAAFGLVLFSVIITVYFARRLTAPLEQMTESISHFKLGNNSSKLDLPEGQNDEIGKLATSFQTLLDALFNSEQRTKAVLNTTMDAIITIDKQGIVLSYNPACVKAFGYNPEEVIGQKINMLMPEKRAAEHDDYLSRYHETGVRHAIGYRREVMARHKDGTNFHIELAVSEVPLGNDVIYTGVIRDITAQKNHERDIHSLLEQLRKSNKELDEFAYIASHDLKEPLRAINNHATLLLEDYGETLEEDGIKRITRTRELCQKMDKLISDLLYFARLGRVDNARRNVNMSSLAQETKELLEDTIEESNAKLSISSDMPTIFCDEVRVGEVFRNLIVNALKYNDSGAPKIKVGYLDESPPVFYVKDNGIGIDEEMKDEVFRIFKRLNKPTDYGSGSGAGLSFVKRIVESHGGQIWVESEPGNGTTFYFTLEKGRQVVSQPNVLSKAGE